MKFGLCGESFGQELSEIWLEEKLGARVFKRERVGTTNAFCSISSEKYNLQVSPSAQS